MRLRKTNLIGFGKNGELTGTSRKRHWWRSPRGVLSNQNMVNYPTVQPDECPDRTARPGRPSQTGLRRTKAGSNANEEEGA